MSSRVSICVFGLIGFVFSASAAAAQERTARDIVDAIVRDGPRARAIRASVDVTRREQLARLVQPNPSIAYTREGAGFTEFLQVEQQLPVFGLRGTLARAGAAASLAAEAERDALLWQLRIEAETAVARLVAEQDRTAITEAAASTVERLVEILRVREREGEGSRFDRLRAEQELADARLAVASARASAAAARTSVAALLPENAAVARITTPLEKRPLPQALDAVLVRAISSRSELKALRAAITQWSAEAAAARAARRPAPSLAVGLKRADVGSSERARGGFFGISVPIPLFDTGRRQAGRWEAEHSRAQLQLAALEQAVRSEVAGAFEVVSTRQQAAAAIPPEASAEELVRTAEVAYREGEIGILQLLDAARTASRARLRAVEIRLDIRLAEAALERAVGDWVWP